MTLFNFKYRVQIFQIFEKVGVKSIKFSFEVHDLKGTTWVKEPFHKFTTEISNFMIIFKWCHLIIFESIHEEFGN